MTQESFYERINGLIEDVNNDLKKKLEKVVASGCIDIEGADDNYLLPKLVLCALLKDEHREFSPDKKEWKKMVDNIYYFV